MSTREQDFLALLKRLAVGKADDMRKPIPGTQVREMARKVLVAHGVVEWRSQNGNKEATKGRERADPRIDLNGSEPRKALPASNRMSETDYERERSALRDTYGDGEGSEKAKGEQARILRRRGG